MRPLPTAPKHPMFFNRRAAVLIDRVYARGLLQSAIVMLVDGGIAEAMSALQDVAQVLRGLEWTVPVNTILIRHPSPSS